MAVNAKTVQGRREVSYGTLDEFPADAEAMAAGETATLGNWSQGQIFWHLAAGLDASIDGTSMKTPWLMKVILNLFMKNGMLTKPMKPGFKIPGSGQKQFGPDESLTTEDGLAILRKAVERQAAETSRASHMAFGDLTREEWDRFNLRHAEPHMSFIIPNQG
jgi:hypothetical protein